MDKRPICCSKLRKVPKQFSGLDQRLVRERSSEQRSHHACALSLLLATVADAQGLRDSAEPSLCQRLSMTGPALHQARQALMTLGLVASPRPLSQVFALDPAPRGATTRVATGAADDAPGDIKAVFARLWEGLA